jgi:signal transduction histidine kinase
VKNKSENKTSGRKSELKSNNHRLAVKTYLAEERERIRIASKIHDGIGQNLVLCNIHLTKVILSSNSDELTQKLQEIKAIIKNTLSEARDIVFEISPPSLVQIGLESTLKELTSRFGAKHNLYAVFETDGQVYEMDADLQILLFQMVRELLVNISKHANAHNVRVSSLKK